MAILRNDRTARCNCDKCGALSYPVPLDFVEKLLEALARRGWRLIDPTTGQPETLCSTCMKAERSNA